MSKRKTIKDPHAKREAEKYESPIPSREFILTLLEERGKPAKQETLCQLLGLSTEQEQEALRRRLRAMERDGQLISNRRGGYGLIDKMNLIRGRVVGHKDGYGFVIPEDGGEDLFLNARHMRMALDGDKVLVRVAGVDHRGRREGAIVEVLEANNKVVVGRLLVENGITLVVPDNKRINQDILIPPGEEKKAKHGQIVMAELITQPSAVTRPIGKVSEILGDHMAPGMEVDIAIRAHKLPYIWPEAVLGEVAQMSEDVPESAKAKRVDLRDLPLVTIDGEDARDFDDAVYCEAKPRGGWSLFVAIADVSHYVLPGFALDQEAQERGNSVYFPGEVIPMLPEILSNGLCSLKPHVDRLCMVCEMSISANGKLTRYQFYPAVMHSKARLTYTQVAALLAEEPEGIRTEYPHLVPHLLELNRLFKVLYAARVARGAIDFETTETRVIFSPERKIEQIVPTQRNDAHRLIEECMLLANVATANFLLKHKMLALYRIHAGPTTEKLADLRSFLAELGLALRGGTQPQPADYGQLLNEIKGRKDAYLIQTVLLRSLSQAVYSPDNSGHFGLAFPAYTHFTSPIRRYPDLLVHRAIRHLLSGKKLDEFFYEKGALQNLGEHCSVTERRADEATRDALDWLKCEYMRDKVGEAFDGIISSVTAFGLFVLLTDVYVEGLVHVTSLNNDYYRYDPIKHLLRGERTGTSYRLGDPLRVKIARVSLDDKKIDLELAESSRSPKTGKTEKESSKKARSTPKLARNKAAKADKPSAAKRTCKRRGR